ncbi:MAG: hypothetical protein IKD76_06270 [Clostridia bacterium]|nr:hypothetical protein [Clostridia bacterium]
MKQRTKSIFLFLIIGMILVTLTGCGSDSNKSKKSNSDSDKLVATKSITEENDGFDAKETIEISFKDDKADKAVITIEFDDEELAEYFEEYFEKGFEEEGFEDCEMKRDGGKITISMKPEGLEDFEGIDAGDFTKKEFKEALEDEGFEVK